MSMPVEKVEGRTRTIYVRDNHDFDYVEIYQGEISEAIVVLPEMLGELIKILTGIKEANEEAARRLYGE